MRKFLLVELLLVVLIAVLTIPSDKFLLEKTIFTMTGNAVSEVPQNSDVWTRIVFSVALGAIFLGIIIINRRKHYRHK